MSLEILKTRISNPTLHGIHCWGFACICGKLTPLQHLGFVGVSLCLLALAPLGWRVGLWQYGFGLYWMMPASVLSRQPPSSCLSRRSSGSELCLRGRVMLGAARDVPSQLSQSHS